LTWVKNECNAVNKTVSCCSKSGHTRELGNNKSATQRQNCLREPRPAIVYFLVGHEWQTNTHTHGTQGQKIHLRADHRTTKHPSSANCNGSILSSQLEQYWFSINTNPTHLTEVSVGTAGSEGVAGSTRAHVSERELKISSLKEWGTTT